MTFEKKEKDYNKLISDYKNSKKIIGGNEDLKHRLRKFNGLLEKIFNLGIDDNFDDIAAFINFLYKNKDSFIEFLNCKNNININNKNIDNTSHEYINFKKINDDNHKKISDIVKININGINFIFIF